MPPEVKPAQLRVRLPFATEAELAEGFGGHLSRTGVFVPTESPRPVGSWIAFEICLSTGEVVLRGDATVARSQRAAPGLRAGMALRFLGVDGESRERLERICAPPPTAADDWVLGIDFGTTGVRVALVRADRPEVVRLGREAVLPAVVAIDDQGRLLVGARARALEVERPERVVAGAKRWVGRRFDLAVGRRAAFALTHDERDEIAADLGGEPFSMTRACAELLRQARQLAQETLGTQLLRAVIGVPAYFNERQRAALRRAAHQAGLTVEQIVGEPTAAAVAFAAGKRLPRRRLLVLDLGGGTFDATVLEIEGDEIDVVATGGDTFLGGADFDARLSNLLAERFEEMEGLSLADDAIAQQRLRLAAETAKVALSSKERTEVALPFIGTRDGAPVDLRLTLERAEVEALCSDLVDQAVAIAREVLAAVRLSPRDVDTLLLAGGMTQMPAVRRAFTEAFGKNGTADVDPGTAVAFGAALLGASARGDERSLGLRELLGATLSVQLPDGKLRPVFGRHTPLPAERRLDVQAPPGARELRVPVYQGKGEDAAKDDFLGALELRDLPAGPGPMARAVLTFYLSADGILRVHARAGSIERSVELATSRGSTLPVGVVVEEAPAEPDAARTAV